MEGNADEEAARLLDRVARAVPVASAPVEELLVAARRARRRRNRPVAALLASVLAGAAVALCANAQDEAVCAVPSTECADFP